VVPDSPHLNEQAPVRASPRWLTLHFTELSYLSRWEKDPTSQKRVPRRVILSAMMDPKRRIAEARDLNNRLMKWRVAMGLDLEAVKRSKVLVLGMGTLGCAVVRTLMVSFPCLSL
jgi:hypothetical protein